MQISEWRLNKSRTTKNRSQSHYKKQDKHVRICTCKSCTLWDKSTRRCDECEKISERKIFAGFAGDKSSTVLDNVKIDTENGESLISIALFIINIIVARRELKQSRTFMCASFVSTFYHVSRNEFHVSRKREKYSNTYAVAVSISNEPVEICNRKPKNCEERKLLCCVVRFGYFLNLVKTTLLRELRDATRLCSTANWFENT